MKILYFCPLWGSESTNFEAFVDKALQVGYDGIELPFMLEHPEQSDEKVRILREAGMPFIGQPWLTATTDLAAHKEEFIQRLHDIARLGPLLIASQTGKDFFTFEYNLQLLRAAGDFEQETGVPIVHETHRGKFSFAARVTRQYLEAEPKLRLCADFSHWCNVSESLLEHQEEAVELAISRSDHIHARVGFEEGPQVPDPRADEWQPALQAHLNWWDKIIERARSEGRKQFTITPEFGPFPYMPAMPHTMQPVASQWDINVYMMQLLRSRYR